MTLIIFIIILSILVLVHEFGHFIVAKRNGVKVEEFGLGIPPRIFGKKIGETIYSINLLPFGGFVKLFGEDSLEGDALHNSRSFLHKTPFQRAQILLAGVAMNFVLACTLYYIFFIFHDFKTFNLPLFFDYKFPFGNEKIVGTVISGFSDNSNLNKVAKMGEAILSIDGQKVSSIAEVREAIATKADREVTIFLQDLTKEATDPTAFRTLKTKPISDESGKPMLGVYLTKSVQISYTTPVQKLFSGILHSWNVLTYSVSSTGHVIALSFKTKDITPVSSSMSGPVGIYQIVGNIVDHAGVSLLLSLIDFTAMLSLSLAFLNVMPFPALDGGRVAFVLLEKARKGKKVSLDLEYKIHNVGMAMLLGFIIIVTLKDIFM